MFQIRIRMRANTHSHTLKSMDTHLNAHTLSMPTHTRMLARTHTVTHTLTCLHTHRASNKQGAGVSVTRLILSSTYTVCMNSVSIMQRRHSSRVPAGIYASQHALCP